MSARVFISYRSSDGADKAAALARELDSLFGDDQIFFDKDDLTGGSRWRDVIRQTLSARPVLLVLVTPHYLGAEDGQGRRRIEQADDPVRHELAEALAAEAHLIPILCDGVAEVPNLAALPRPLNELGERTWRRLRTYDWRNDVARLAGDLRTLGLDARPLAAGPIAARPSPAAPAAASGSPRRGALAALLGAFVLLAAGGGAWWWSQREPSGIGGLWHTALGVRGASNVQDGQRFQFRIEQQGHQVRMVSTPVEIDRDPAWSDYRQFWKERTGQDLRRVLYRGEGTLQFDPGQPGALVVPMRIEAVPGNDGLDSGELSGTIDDGGLRIRGKLWLNSEQADRIIDMHRGSAP